MNNNMPEEGEEYTFTRHTGYVFIQDRPSACRYYCICNKCDGEYTRWTEKIREIVYYADNSIEIVAESGHREMYRAPNGDLCF